MTYYYNLMKRKENLMSSKARVLDFEIKTDEKRGINPVSKKAHLAKMKDNIEKITEKLGNHLKNVNGKISSNTQSSSSNEIIKKNQQSEDTTISGKRETGDKMLIKQQQAVHNINHYKNNNKDTVKAMVKKLIL